MLKVNFHLFAIVTEEGEDGSVLIPASSDNHVATQVKPLNRRSEGKLQKSFFLTNECENDAWGEGVMLLELGRQPSMRGKLKILRKQSKDCLKASLYHLPYWSSHILRFSH